MARTIRWLLAGLLLLPAASRQAQSFGQEDDISLISYPQCTGLPMTSDQKPHSDRRRR